MFTKAYSWFHRLVSQPKERGEYSSGYWQDSIRREALILCQGLCGRVLEIGCGEGLFLTQLAKRNSNLKIFGIDNNNNRLSVAKEKSKEENLRNINLSLQETTKLSFRNGYFDAVVCINVIFNLDSLAAVKKVFQEMARVCKRGARIIIDFRNSKNPLLYLKYRLAPFYDQTVKNLPLRTYRLEDIQVLLNEAGLGITNKVYIGSFIRKIAPVIILKVTKF